MKNIIVAVEQHLILGNEDIFAKTVVQSEPIGKIAAIKHAVNAKLNMNNMEYENCNGMIEYQLYYYKVNRAGKIISKSRIE